MELYQVVAIGFFTGGIFSAIRRKKIDKLDQFLFAVSFVVAISGFIK